MKDKLNKVCTICKIEKPMSEFSPNGSRHKQTIYPKSHCKLCEIKRLKAWRKDNPEKFKSAQRRNNLRQLYNITLEEYQTMFVNQNGLCKVCGQKEATRQSLSVDHCHKTNKIRGLLCHKCNRALGLLQDDENLIRKLLSYLIESQLTV